MGLLKKCFIGFFVILFLASILMIFLDPKYNVEISENQINNAVENKLPLSKENSIKVPFIGMRNAKFEIDKLNADLISENVDTTNKNGYVNLIGSMSSNLDGSNFDADFNVNGRLVYDSGNFYIHDIEFKSFDLKNYELSDADKTLIKKANTVSEISSDLKDKAISFLRKKELVENNENFKKGVDDYISDVKTSLILKSKEFVIARIEDIPVYSLNGKDYKQSLATMAISEMFVDNDSFHIVLSAGKLVTNIYLYVISLLSGLCSFLLFFSNKMNGKFL